MPIKNSKPLIISVFGITGDLATKKIVPAIFHLFKTNKLPKKFALVGFARKDLTKEQFKELLEKTIPKTNKTENFLNKCLYFKADFFNKDDYDKFGQFILNLDKDFGECSDKIFHLSIPPDLHKIVLENLYKAGLSIVCKGRKDSFARFLVEKPFGHDLKSSKELLSLAERLFTKNEIFMVDHYNSKDFVKKIKSYKFDYKNIEKITIRFLEKDDVSKRAIFYDKVGLIKDVFQSHIFQIMLAILDKNRDKVLSSIDFDESSLSVGQYREYRKHEAVSDKSKTETFFRGIFHFKKGVLEGVPIEVVSGKKMPKKQTEVLFKTSNGKEIVFQPKNETANAYEDVIYQALLGKKNIFAKKEEVLSAWKLTERILEVTSKKKISFY
jgi:glucose-6-phosphate 1-dehydrogenase